MALAALRTSACGDWEPCGDAFYARELLYDLPWGLDLQERLLCCAPYGGPIAAMRDPGRLVVLPAAASGRPLVRIFNAAGLELGSFLWEAGRPAAWGWTDALELAMVERGGRVHFYTMFGAKLARELSFGKQLEGEGVGLARVWGDGLLVVGAGSHVMWAAGGLAGGGEPRASCLAPLPGAEEAPPRCVAVIEPRRTLSGGLEVVVGAGDALWLVDEASAVDHPLPAGCGGAVALEVSPEGQFVALFTGDGRLLVLSADLSSTLVEFSTQTEVPPASMAWCGMDAVALRWEGLLLLVGPYGDCLRLPSDEAAVLVPEVDALRLVTSGAHHSLRRVADCLVQVFKPGSTAPAAVLWDARDAYDAGSARADRLLRGLRGEGQLEEGVEACIGAAGLDSSVPRQRALLRAAVLGRPFCSPAFPPTALHEAAVKLRILNAVRGDPAVGLPLTLLQLEALTLPALITRLVAGRHFLLAFRMAGAAGAALGGGSQAQARVLEAWAAAKIAASPDVADAELREVLAAKMRSVPGASWAHLAAEAQAQGRRSLAVALLEEEGSAAQQVPLLLSLAQGEAPGAARREGGPARSGAASPLGAAAEGEDDTLSRALKKAIESGDTDLVHLALFAAYKARPLPDFWRLVAPRALARNLFAKYMTAQEPQLLETLYTSQPNLPGGGDLPDLKLGIALRKLQEGVSRGGRPSEAAVTQFVAALNQAAAAFGQAREAGGQAFQARAAADFATLAREQARLERDTGQALFLGLGLADTLRQLLRLGHARHAASLRKTFSVAEPRWYALRLGVLAEMRDWDALEAFAAERKSPIGWEPFLEAARSHGAPREYQARLVARLPDSAAKAEAYQAIGYAREAAEVAAKLKDGDLLSRIAGAVAPGAPAAAAIQQLWERLPGTRGA